ncbi:hypothetical protein BOTBODRAFT_178587 [Botryobasidium botryosum FD-172 SS1]|uniref:Zn(2)-C6 fungal-type domain-containing protein n=1 Tax=Botryobasidium botryosum (strain FD-172 SS1) TaxID=930990 RepID=A0A067M5P8_BOTB1|nr:hypothetical protein BOTBODRAFT_178587 [Botryobasidium botryosum FD-172 SS1]
MSIAKKQRRDDERPPPEPAKPLQLQRRRVWRACESCRRKKIKCDGREPVCAQCTQGGNNCTWIQTKDRAALSRHYVQELEARLVQMEGLLTQVAPVVELLGQSPNGIALTPAALSSLQAQAQAQAQAQTQAQSQPQSHLPLQTPDPAASLPLSLPLSDNATVNPNHLTNPNHPNHPSHLTHAPAAHPEQGEYVKQEPPAEPEDVTEQFGQLALDDHGHLRWIGGSSTVSLIEAFKHISNISTAHNPSVASSPESERGEAEAMEDGDEMVDVTPPPEPSVSTPAVNMLYFQPSLRFGSRIRALPHQEEVEYPPRDLADKLVSAYFTNFHHTLPVVDKLRFMTKYTRLMECHQIPTHSDAGFVSLVFAVFACAARFVDDERVTGKAGGSSNGNENGGEPKGAGVGEDGGLGMVYYERAMILYYIGQTASQLAHVQAFVLLSSFLASINSLPQAWLLCGQAIRIAQDLGLHRSPRNLYALKPIEMEIRRKVWWCVYGLDRMLAVALGRPLGINDDDCDAELPLPIDEADLPAYFEAHPQAHSNSITPVGSPAMPTHSPSPSPQFQSAQTPTLMQGFIALTSLYKLAGKILRSVYALDKCKDVLEPAKLSELQASVERLDAELNAWCDALPVAYKSDPRTPEQVSLGAVLCTSYYALMITLHRNFLPTRRNTHRNRDRGGLNGGKGPGMTRSSASPASVAKAVSASRSLIFLAQSVQGVIPPSHYLAFFIQYLFSSAVIILLCVMHATDAGAARTAMGEVEACVRCLEALEGRWPGARKCLDLLEELVGITKESRDGRESGASGVAQGQPGGRKRAGGVGEAGASEDASVGEEGVRQRAAGRRIKARPGSRMHSTERMGSRMHSKERMPSTSAGAGVGAGAGGRSASAGNSPSMATHSPGSVSYHQFQAPSAYNSRNSLPSPINSAFPVSYTIAPSALIQQQQHHASSSSTTTPPNGFAYENVGVSQGHPAMMYAVSPTWTMQSPSAHGHDPQGSSSSGGIFRQFPPLSPFSEGSPQMTMASYNYPLFPFDPASSSSSDPTLGHSHNPRNHQRNDSYPYSNPHAHSHSQYLRSSSSMSPGGGFDLTGIPFSGLDFLHNFTDEGQLDLDFDMGSGNNNNSNNNAASGSNSAAGSGAGVNGSGGGGGGGAGSASPAPNEKGGGNANRSGSRKGSTAGLGSAGGGAGAGLDGKTSLDELWQDFGAAGVFRVGPDLPFSLGEAAPSESSNQA